MVEEKLVQFDDGEVERIFDDELVEAVCDTDPISQSVVRQRDDGCQNRSDSFV